ncbi:hypothetical protein NPA08_02315 [Mycoplasmopsis citelli]|uniref:hypothetical protein n=1 Tax=Mycoplasmopsis citelli TaxID=171281 RepID=UPI00211397C2|nr:hypothetical protein [Mycoplasmopsis citelli]UUD35780.1 hypothetical protein NPA08_02315 [Mycoplasmopsis citelli]
MTLNNIEKILNESLCNQENDSMDLITKILKKQLEQEKECIKNFKILINCSNEKPNEIEQTYSDLQLNTTLKTLSKSVYILSNNNLKNIKTNKLELIMLKYEWNFENNIKNNSKKDSSEKLVKNNNSDDLVNKIAFELKRKSNYKILNQNIDLQKNKSIEKNQYIIIIFELIFVFFLIIVFVLVKLLRVGNILMLLEKFILNVLKKVANLIINDPLIKSKIVIFMKKFLIKKWNKIKKNQKLTKILNFMDSFISEK